MKTLVLIKQTTEPGSGSQIDMQTVENIFCDKVRSWIQNAVAMVDTKVQEKILSAKDELVVSRMEIGT